MKVIAILQLLAGLGLSGLLVGYIGWHVRARVGGWGLIAFWPIAAIVPTALMAWRLRVPPMPEGWPSPFLLFLPMWALAVGIVILSLVRSSSATFDTRVGVRSVAAFYAGILAYSLVYLASDIRSAFAASSSQ